MHGIDLFVEGGGISADQWQAKYEIEAELEKIYNMEEIYWQQRGNALWIMNGGANTDFFRQFANGRRSKKAIISLETDHGEIKT